MIIHVICYLCVALVTYAGGYPTTEGEVVIAKIQRPEGIAENSSIICKLSDCHECPALPPEYNIDCKKLNSTYYVSDCLKCCVVYVILVHHNIDESTCHTLIYSVLLFSL